MNTAIARSKISYVGGTEGVLLYRGYRIEDLVEHSTFLEVAFLLIYGELPTPEEHLQWSSRFQDSLSLSLSCIPSAEAALSSCVPRYSIPLPFRPFFGPAGDSWLS